MPKSPYELWVSIHVFLQTRNDLFITKMAFLTLCLLGNFSCFLSSADFFQTQLFSKNSFSEYHQSIKQFESRSCPTFCRA